MASFTWRESVDAAAVSIMAALVGATKHAELTSECMVPFEPEDMAATAYRCANALVSRMRMEHEAEERARDQRAEAAAVARVKARAGESLPTQEG